MYGEKNETNLERSETVERRVVLDLCYLLPCSSLSELSFQFHSVTLKEKLNTAGVGGKYVPHCSSH